VKLSWQPFEGRAAPASSFKKHKPHLSPLLSLRKVKKISLENSKKDTIN
jgi:hypothetical protein